MEDKIKLVMLKTVAMQLGISEEAAAELLFNTSEDGSKTTLKDDAFDILKAKDKERVSKLKSDSKTEIFNEAYAKAKKEVLTKTEKSLATKYGIEGDFKMDKLVEKIIETNTTMPNEIDENTIKTHPVYLAFERSKNEEIANQKRTYEEQIESVKTEQKRTETMRGIKSEVTTLFNNLKPVLSTDANKAKNQTDAFVKRFEDYEYKKQEDGSYLILQNGQRIDDGHGNPISLNKLVSDLANQYYDFAQQSSKGNAGNGGDNSGNGGFKVPTNEDEYTMAILNATSDEEIAKIDAAYSESQN